jgi:hypothetical protein
MAQVENIYKFGWGLQYASSTRDPMHGSRGLYFYFLISLLLVVFFVSLDLSAANRTGRASL